MLKLIGINETIFDIIFYFLPAHKFFYCQLLTLPEFTFLQTGIKDLEEIAYKPQEIITFICETKFSK